MGPQYNLSASCRRLVQILKGKQLMDRSQSQGLGKAADLTPYPLHRVRVCGHIGPAPLAEL